MSALEAERAAWSGKQGDDWGQDWDFTSSRVYEVGTLLVQLRDEAGVLIATSEGASTGVLAIDVSGCDFTGPAQVFSWWITGTDDIPEGRYVIEAECVIDDRKRTFFSHDWTCEKQWAVAS